MELLDEGESLELVQFNLTVEDENAWDAGETMNNLTEKHFNQRLPYIFNHSTTEFLMDFKKNYTDLYTPIAQSKVATIYHQTPIDLEAQICYRVYHSFHYTSN